MTHRFYAPDASRTGRRVRLPDGEAAHLTHTLRLQAGAGVQVFDGRGHEFEARIQTIERTGVLVETLGAVESAGEARVGLTLAQAVLKGRKFDTVVRDATMLGVTGVRPLVTAHTDIPAVAARADSPPARWQRIAIASAKQCGRAVVPVIESATTFDQHLTDTHDDLHLVLVEPARGQVCARLETLASRPFPTSATITIGPEGGWTDTELTQARAAGCTLLTLGSRTLRADAAPIAAVAVLLFLWGDL